jgi:expansin (peptidoglycan-binding protein)
MSSLPPSRLAARAASRLVVLLLALGAAAAARAAVPCTGFVSGSGDATFYSYAPGTGACGFVGDDSGALVAAMNPVDYAGAAMCGAWVRVNGPLGQVIVRIVDLGPGLAAGDIDLNAPAFALIADPLSGRVAVTWETVASPVDEYLAIRVREGSNPWWTGLQVRGHGHAIAALEYLSPGGYVAVPRQSYNDFIIDGSLGVPLPIATPFTVRLTDVHGQQEVIGGLAPSGPQVFTTTQQFPACVPATSAAPLPASPRVVLEAPTPNPFNPRTSIAFALAERGPVTLRVHDAAGRLRATLLEAAVLGAGRHELAWDGRDGEGRPAPGGLYLFRLEAAGEVAVRKAVLLK